MMSRILATFVILAVLMIPGCTQEPTGSLQTIVIEDDYGRLVELPKHAQRIVSLSPSHTETLFAMGLGDRLVAGTEHDDYPAEALDLPKVGGFATPNIEVIVALEPDLVLATSIHQQSVEALEQLSIPVLALEPTSLDHVFANITKIGNATGTEQIAGQLVQSLQEEITIITTSLGDLLDNDRPRVYYEIWDDPLITVGPNTLINDLLTLAGGQNIAGDAQKPWPELSLEVILKADPQVIIRPRNEHGEVNAQFSDFAHRTGWENISAVQTGRIFFVDDDLVSRPGPRLIKGLAQLVAALHPDAVVE